MTLKSYTRSRDDVTVIDLEGRITLGEASGGLRDAVKNALAQGQKKIILDLTRVSYIDSAGLGELVGVFMSASNSGAEIKLVGLQKKVKGLMQVTRLCTVFETFEDEDTAVRSFAKASPAQARLTQ